MALVSATPRSPFHAVLPADYESSGPLRWLSDLIGLSHLDTTALVIVGLLATVSAAAAFIYVLREACSSSPIPISRRT